MKTVATVKLVYRFLALGGLSLCLWAVSARTAQQQDKFIPVVISEQLPSKAGVIPVYLSCGQARLSSEYTIDEFRCTLKNNTSLKITAINAPYSIVVERSGSASTDTTNSVLENLIHPDFKSESKLIAPGDDFSFGPPGPISYSPGEVIKSVEIVLDYVQFEDDTKLGPDRAGSRIINAMRAGAKKYKSWVKQQYNLHERSITATTSDVADDNSVLVGLTDENEKIGASEYRRKFQKLAEKHPADIKRLLDSNR